MLSDIISVICPPLLLPPIHHPTPPLHLDTTPPPHSHTHTHTQNQTVSLSHRAHLTTVLLPLYMSSCDAELPAPDLPHGKPSESCESPTSAAEPAAVPGDGTSPPAQPTAHSGARILLAASGATEWAQPKPQSGVSIAVSEQPPVQMMVSIPDMDASWSAKVAVSSAVQVGLDTSPHWRSTPRRLQGLCPQCSASGPRPTHVPITPRRRRRRCKHAGSRCTLQSSPPEFTGFWLQSKPYIPSSFCMAL